MHQIVPFSAAFVQNPTNIIVLSASPIPPLVIATGKYYDAHDLNTWSQYRFALMHLKGLKRMKPTIFYILCITYLMSTSMVAVSCSKQDDTNNNTENQLPTGPSDYQKLIKEAYLAKKTGHNQKALVLFRQAIKKAAPQSTLYASALDDQSSVLMRMGKYSEAQKLFEKSISILKKGNGSPILRSGVEGRLETLKALQHKNIKCNEPGEPTAENELPYYPIVPDFQRALGTLTRKIAKCHDSSVIEPIAMRAIITGSGKLVRAYSRDKFHNTDTEKCVIKKLEQLLPKTSLPKFAACYRGFTYPFMIGNHPEKKSAVKKAPEVAASAAEPQGTRIPKQNTQKGPMPKKESALEGSKRLLRAYKTGEINSAMEFFFPAKPFEIVKDSANPTKYYKKLMDWYTEDISLESPRLKGNDWQVEDIQMGACKWKAPGTEGNKIGYWSCTRNTVTVVAGEKKRRFEIRVLINWGTNWYITHLRPIR